MSLEYEVDGYDVRDEKDLEGCVMEECKVSAKLGARRV